MTGNARRLAALALLLLAGILAGAQLGKIAPLVGWYHSQAGLSLVMVGWLTSTLGGFVALAALPAAFAIDRAGMYASFVASSFAASSFASASATPAATSFFSARISSVSGPTPPA